MGGALVEVALEGVLHASTRPGPEAGMGGPSGLPPSCRSRSFNEARPGGRDGRTSGWPTASTTPSFNEARPGGRDGRLG